MFYNLLTYKHARVSSIILLVSVALLFVFLSTPIASAAPHDCIDGIDNDVDTYVDEDDTTCDGAWDIKSVMPTPRGGPQATVLNGEVYAIGGRSSDFPENNLTTVEIYSPDTDSWRTGTPMQQGRLSQVSEEVNGKIYSISGLYKVRQQNIFNILTSIEEYDPVLDMWTYKADIPTGRYGAVSAVLNDEIYVIGGTNLNASGQVTSALPIMEVYNPATDSWNSKTPPTLLVHNAGAEVVDGKLYLVGGQDVNEVSIDAVQVYDPATDTWSAASPIPVGRISPGIAVIGDSIFVYGGHQRTPSGAPFSDDVHEYDTVTDQWFRRADMPTARSQFGSVQLDGELYSIGGSTYNGQAVFHNEVEVFTPSFTEGIAPNNPPVLDLIGDKSVAEGQTLQFTVTATDPDGDNLVFSATNTPAGSSFDPNTGVFSWTPGYSAEGNYINIEFTVVDDGSPMELDMETITITVGNVNRAPVFANPGPQEVLEAEFLTFALSATDPDGDNVSISASNTPTGANFDGTTFTWVPNLMQEGVYVVSFVATDNGTPNESALTEVIITVGDNPTPTEQAEDLVGDVIDLTLPNNIENSYLANLKKVEKFIEEGKVNPAINQLNTFISKVEQDYSTGDITQAVHDDLIEAAENLIEDLGGN